MIPAKRTVLVVDDESDVLKTLEVSLKRRFSGTHGQRGQAGGRTARAERSAPDTRRPTDARYAGRERVARPGATDAA